MSRICSVLIILTIDYENGFLMCGMHMTGSVNIFMKLTKAESLGSDSVNTT